MDKACKCAKGWAELVAHTASTVAVAKKLLRVLGAGSERVVRVLHLMAQHTTTPGMVREMEEVGAVAELGLKDLQRDYGIELDYHKVWKGKELVMHNIHGTEKGCYDRLRWYCRAIRETNPGNVAECEIDPAVDFFE
ncbi:hypothetical protein ZIOFF_057935 [Zingiber officinale]|uniref:U-box domain-containing protein n=1 Tax=Zingiber officinale TaxID=94328 RepID=A0A8J5KLG1_ZINOF|nr:hypothetical protein ZIOFF_057935 [Zingiber officinale]